MVDIWVSVQQSFDLNCSKVLNIDSLVVVLRTASSHSKKVKEELLGRQGDVTSEVSV